MPQACYDFSPGNELKLGKVLGQVHSVETMSGHPSLSFGGENTWEGCDRRLRFIYLFLHYDCFLPPTPLYVPQMRTNRSEEGSQQLTPILF